MAPKRAMMPVMSTVIDEPIARAGIKIGVKLFRVAQCNCRANDRSPGPVGRSTGFLRASAPDHFGIVPHGTTGQFERNSGFADAWFARDQGQPAAAQASRVERRARGSDFLLPATENPGRSGHAQAPFSGPRYHTRDRRAVKLFDIRRTRRAH